MMGSLQRLDSAMPRPMTGQLSAKYRIRQPMVWGMAGHQAPNTSSRLPKAKPTTKLNR